LLNASFKDVGFSFADSEDYVNNGPADRYVMADRCVRSRLAPAHPPVAPRQILNETSLTQVHTEIQNYPDWPLLKLPTTGNCRSCRGDAKAVRQSTSRRRFTMLVRSKDPANHSGRSILIPLLSGSIYALNTQKGFK